MSTIHILYLGNNSIVDVTGLKNETSGEYVTDANISVALYDAAGLPVAGTDWPLAMPYLADSNGVYRATLPFTLALVEGARYVARIVADAGEGLRAQWDMPCVGRLRT
jgi:hypothetical protein